MLKWTTVASSLFLLTNPVWAQSGEQCRAVYDAATRNIAISETSYSSLNTIYDQYCSAAGEIKSDESSIGLESVVKKIPLKFTGNSDSYSQKMQSFCKQYSELRFTSAASSYYTDSVVVDALRAFNYCIEISKKNIDIEMSTANGITSSFSVKFGSNVNYQVQGVVLEDAIECTSDLGSGDSSQKVDETTVKDVKVNFSVNCRRIAVSREGGSKYYPRTSIIIGSNHGPYSAIFPAEEILDVEFASGLERRIASFEDRLSAISQQIKIDGDNIAKVDLRLTATENDMRNKLRVRSYALGRGEKNAFAGDWQWIGCANEEEYAKTQCETEMTDVRVLYSQVSTSTGDGCGYTRSIVTCLGIGR